MTLVNYAKFPDFEQRTSRETFTAKLSRICAQLDERGPQQVAYNHWFDRERKECLVTPVRLWVVGSYARGAMTCGDLDLILEIESFGRGEPPASTVTRALFGTHANVRTYLGTPLNNTSGAEFEEALLVWERTGANWKDALASIRPRADAGRFDRKTDVIPLRMEQHKLVSELVDELLEGQEAGRYTWRFVPLSEMAHAQPCTESDVRALEMFSEQSVMKKKLATPVLALLQTLCREKNILAALDCGYSSGSLKSAGCFVQAEQMSTTPFKVDEFDCTTYAFIPALNVRGPNGFWVVERGDKHPLVQLFAGLVMWTLAGPDGVMGPYQALHYPDDSNWPTTAQFVDLFSSLEEAEAMVRAFKADDDSVELVAKEVSGRALLDLLASADVALLNGDLERLILNRDGMRFCQAEEVDGDVMSPTQIVEILKRLMS